MQHNFNRGLKKKENIIVINIIIIIEITAIPPVKSQLFYSVHVHHSFHNDKHE